MNNEINELINLFNKSLYKELINKARILLKKDPNHFILWNILGVAHKMEGDLEEAKLSFENSIRIKPEFPDPYNNLGAILLETYNLDEAINSFNIAIKLKEDYVDAYANLGLVYKEKNFFQKALTILNKGLSYDLNNNAILFNIGEVYEGLNNYKKAEEYYLKVVKSNPQNVNYLYKLASLYKDQEKYDLSLNFLKKILNTNDNSEIINKAKFWINAIEGNNLTTPPENYVKDLFDNYSNNFEKSLVNNLEYSAPKLIAKTLLEIKNLKDLGNVIDMGCGTGLIGKEIKQYCNNLIGVDISQKMLDLANKKNIYNKLYKSEIKNYLTKNDLNFDLFIFADVFVYMGKLNHIFDLIKSKNKKKGHLIFTIELNENKNFFLEKTGRYSHSKDYIIRCLNKLNYKVLKFLNINLRKHKNGYVKGALILASFN